SLGDSNNTVEGNTISGNHGNGVVIDGIGADNDFVYGNTVSGNSGFGVGLLGGAVGNVVGDVGPLANSVSANGGAGVVIRDQGFNYFPTPDGTFDILVADAPPAQTAVRGNAVFDNSGPDVDVAPAA